MTVEIVLAAVLMTSPHDASPAVGRETWVPDVIMTVMTMELQWKVKHDRLENYTSWVEAVLPSVVAMAINEEVYDDREIKQLTEDDPVSDLKYIQKRYKDFSDCPYVGEVHRFPERKLVQEYLAQNRAVRNHFVARRAVDLLNEEELTDGIKMCDELHHIWNNLKEASTLYYYITVRRNDLSLLRERLGREAFYEGRMPPHLPSCR